jgi:hypothetical protein
LIEQCSGGSQILLDVEHFFAVYVGLQRFQSLPQVETNGFEIDCWCGWLCHRVALLTARSRGQLSAGTPTTAGLQACLPQQEPTAERPRIDQLCGSGIIDRDVAETVGVDAVGRCCAGILGHFFAVKILSGFAIVANRRFDIAKVSACQIGKLIAR